MALAGDEFRGAAMALVCAWEASHRECDVPLWQWRSFRHPHGLPPPDTAGGYLVLEDVPVAYNNNINDETNTEEEEGPITNEACRDDIATANIDTPRVHLYTYHILYNESYKVPSLFFNARHPDGRQLDLHQVQKNLPSASQEELQRHRWTFLTLEDHPYLHSPWFALHPCGTSGLMSTIFLPSSEAEKPHSNPQLSRKVEIDRGIRYLLTWLSLAADAAGLTLPSETFAKLISHSNHGNENSIKISSEISSEIGSEIGSEIQLH